MSVRIVKSLFSLLSVVKKHNAKSPAQVRVGTYNLRRAILDSESPENNWAAREPRLIRSILDNSFDFCGVQEVDTAEQTRIPELLAEAGADYDSYFFSPYAKDGKGTKAHGLIWRRNRFRLVGKPHFFWLSEPPTRMQPNDFGADGEQVYVRGGFCLSLKDRKAGRKYFVMVTHAPLNREQHARNAHIFLDMEKRYNPRNYASFFVGDFNACETDEASGVYRSRWRDSYRAFDAQPELIEGPEGTFNGWQPDVEPTRRIDFIYYRGTGVTPLCYRCNDSRYDELLASDHFPVSVDFNIK